MDIRPIFSTLRRHRTAASLIVLEIALSCAILSNAVHLITKRVEAMQAPSGLVENEIVKISLGGISRDANADAQTAQDLAVLAQVANVKHVTILNQIPYGNSNWNSGINLDPDQQVPTLSSLVYNAGPDFIDTLGLQVIAGRAFTPDEYKTNTEAYPEGSDDAILPFAMVTEETANRLFPDGALGREFYVWGKHPIRIIGIVRNLAPIQQNGNRWAFFVPVRLAYNEGGAYFLRTDPAHREQVLKDGAAALEKANRSRVLLDHTSFSDIRDDHFRDDRNMVGLLTGVGATLLVVTAFGIVGLASFWVQQRTRMIGIRRALGATHGQILRYFQAENFLLTTIGIVVGLVGAYGINQVLLQLYEVERLPLWAIPVSAVTLWVLGQVAVLGPALRAAALPPVAVMRSA
ncbi:ABC transporter permease [soil metagenome]